MTDAPAGEDAIQVNTAALIALRSAGEALANPRTHIRAALSGGYRSSFKGRGMEFEETRPYQPGDDLRYIDWRVTARSGRTHTKIYREERERPVLLWIDYRRTMFFATRGRYKSVIAARAAALLAWHSIHHGDRVGGLVFSDDQHHELRPERGKAAALRLFRHLAKPVGEAAGVSGDSLRPALSRLRRVARPGSLIYLLSDFRGLDEDGELHLLRLARHNALVMIMISDPLETQLPPAARYRIAGPGQTRTIHTGDGEFRRRYAGRYRARVDELEMLCRRGGLRLIHCSTRDDPGVVLRRESPVLRGR